MKRGQHQIRLILIFAFFVIIFVILLARVYQLAILERDFLLGQGNSRSIRTINIPAYRGMISDREGVPLAISTPVKSAWVVPKAFSADKKQFESLAKLLNLSSRKLAQRIQAAQEREFLYLQRQINPILASKIAALQIHGLYFQEEFKRYYPQAETSAQLVGFTDLDDNGIEGIELAYQDWLMGIVGKKRVLKDRMGEVIEELDVIKEPRPGHELQLSIDSRMQYFAYHELQTTLEKFGAKSGSVVIVDTQTGEVLAIANAPSFNPNIRNNYQLDRYRNKAITDSFEPGSVIKPFSIASALDSGRFNTKSVIDTNPSWMTVQGHIIRDIRNYGVLDVTGVLQHSSNVGVTKMVLSSPPEQLIQLLRRTGVGQRTESSYPGENEGALVKIADANPFVLATLGFGYGVSVTALQLAKGYLIFAKNGKLIPINLLHTNKPVEEVAIISPKIAKDVLTMMEAVVEGDGTGRLAKVPGYRVAGKTGTARIAGKQGYEENRHIASFVGIAPVSNPRLIVAVVIHEPSRVGYYGGMVAAPLFANVMSMALRTLNIPCDDQ